MNHYFDLYLLLAAASLITTYAQCLSHYTKLDYLLLYVSYYSTSGNFGLYC